MIGHVSDRFADSFLMHFSNHFRIDLTIFFRQQFRSADVPPSKTDFFKEFCVKFGMHLYLATPLLPGSRIHFVPGKHMHACDHSV